MPRPQWTYLEGRPRCPDARSYDGGAGGAGGAAADAGPQLPSLDFTRLRRPPACFHVRGVTDGGPPAVLKALKKGSRGLMGLPRWNQVRPFLEFVSGPGSGQVQYL